MEIAQLSTYVSHLRCSSCGTVYDLHESLQFAPCCGKPLMVEYRYFESLPRSVLADRPATMWRYFEMLPLLEEKNRISLGEGMTPILPLKRLGERFGCPGLLLKDESQNPTGSFKSRGMSMAISKAYEAGIGTCIVPTAGNAGGAMSAYCAKAGMEAIVVMPRHTPRAFVDECEAFGAEVILVEGLISDCAKKVAELSRNRSCLDVSTLKEPFRLEGKKTMGYEIAEQLHWQLPDVIIYPTGGGTGLIGIWKAIKEMQQLGWLRQIALPRMIAVQAENCQPIVQTWLGRQPNARQYRGQATLASGLAVPHPFGEDLILEVLQASGGFPIAVSDDAILQAWRELALEEGLYAAPEGAATWAALKILLQQNLVLPHEKVLLLNTGSADKYRENLKI